MSFLQETEPFRMAIALAAEYNRSIFPVKLNKFPLVKWAPFQLVCPTVEQLQQWEETFSPPAWAMVTGSISGVVTLDWDGPEGETTRDRLGIPKHRITGSGGSQSDFYHPGWKIKSLNRKSSGKSDWTVDYPGLDTRADGGIALVAGRSAKGPYVWVREPDDLLPLDMLPLDLREGLGLLHAPVEKAPTEPRARVISAPATPVDSSLPLADQILERYLGEIGRLGGRNNACFSLACQLRDNDFSQSATKQICSEFARRAPTTDQHGDYDPFTDAMAYKCVESAWTFSARSPWEKKRQRKQEQSETYEIHRIPSEEHKRILSEASDEIRESVRAHIKERRATILVENVPPGVGKSSVVSELGAQTTQDVGNFDIAWIAQRHDMATNIDGLKYFHHIQPCTETNCPYHKLHHELGAKGFNTWVSVHTPERGEEKENPYCAYAQQFLEGGSTVYMDNFVPSSWPLGHNAIVIDELDPPSWLPEYEVSLSKIKACIGQHAVGSDEDVFLRRLEALIVSSEVAIRGKAVFDAIDKISNGHLANWLGVLHSYYECKPVMSLDIDQGQESAMKFCERMPHVILPHIIKGFTDELVKWQRGKEWNSCIRIGPAKCGEGNSLYITEVRKFKKCVKRDTLLEKLEEGEEPEKIPLPPIVLLDATADKEIHGRIFEAGIDIHRIEMQPAPGTQHIAVRTGKRYGKVSLTTRKKDETASNHLIITIKQCKYLLKKLDPTGSAIKERKVGLISFMGCVKEIGKALLIPEERQGHFWGIRGSNALADCSILFVVGTPTIRPDELFRQASAIYRDDPDPLIDVTPEEWQSAKCYSDPRLQHYAEYMKNAELTQCAHRSRAMRYENRIVVSFCDADIDFLPITTKITELPYLADDGQQPQVHCDERIAQAYQDLLSRGIKPTRDVLSHEAKARHSTVSEWLRSRHEESASTCSLGENPPIRCNNNYYYSYGDGIFLANIPEQEGAENPSLGKPKKADKEDSEQAVSLVETATAQVELIPETAPKKADSPVETVLRTLEEKLEELVQGLKGRKLSDDELEPIFFQFGEACNYPALPYSPIHEGRIAWQTAFKHHRRKVRALLQVK